MDRNKILHWIWPIIKSSIMQAVMELNVGGNLHGDGFQNGGVLVVDKGGKTLHLYVQESPADHEDNMKILKVNN